MHLNSKTCLENLGFLVEIVGWNTQQASVEFTQEDALGGLYLTYNC
jgi:hypothetical protein